MSEAFNSGEERGQPMIYQFRIEGHLGREWNLWFDGMTVTPEDNGETTVTGPVADQAALHGLLRKLRDLGLPLLSVACLERDHAAEPDDADEAMVNIDTGGEHS
jgi:hypothetical protein